LLRGAQSDGWIESVTALHPSVAGLDTVRIVGTGLLGTSIGLKLRGLGVRVLLSDPSPMALALARDVGAGEPDPGGVPVSLVVVGAPPDVTASVVAAELARHPEATVTDVASVKAGIWAAVLASGADITRYVGGHPMAGRERSGPVAARADLFLGRPWVVCPADSPTAATRTDPARVELVRRLAAAVGASPVVMPAVEHDEAVSLISHVPQIAASLVAARLVKASDPAVGLAGQGLRDVTRVADSDPALWAQILTANAGPVGRVLREIRSDLDGLISALSALEAADSGRAVEATGADGGSGGTAAPSQAIGSRAAVARVIADGRTGRERIPGKHGEPVTRYAVVTALLPDTAGQLARLFNDIGEAGINVEEFGLEHAPGQKVGLAGVSVLPAAREALEKALIERGWHVVA
jgi:prephenate dehydrogenase